MANSEPTLRPQRPIPDAELLDVGIIVFDPGVPDGNQRPAKTGIFPEVRNAEARYIPHRLGKTLEETGHWGTVRVVPAETNTVDIIVTGRIIESDGANLVVNIEARDATGRTWLTKDYAGTASKYSYTETTPDRVDPFQSVYNSIANDMAAAKERFSSSEIERIRTISELKFARDFSPDVFDDYLTRNDQGFYTIQRLPARDDPMLVRVRSIRERDRRFLDVLDQHYGAFARSMEESYQAWRTSSYQEVMVLRKVERSARNQMVLGAAAAIGGLAGATMSESALGTATGTASAVGGAMVFNRGVQKYFEAEMHREFVRELNDSFAREVGPRVVEVEGRVITLTGSAEVQYREWRRLLQQLYRTEMGFPITDTDGD